MIYIWISMLINQLSFFFFRIRDERMDSSIKGSHMTSPHYDSDRLRSLDYDSKILLNKNLPTIALWEKSHENVHCNFFFQRKCSAFHIKGISFNCIAQINFRPNQRNSYVKRNIYHGFHHIRKNNSILIIIRNHLKCAYNVDFWDIIPQTVRGS